MNATRHGLAIPIHLDSHLQAEIRQLARLLEGNNADRHRRYFANMAAEAEIELRRIQRVRNSMISAQFAAVSRDSGRDGAAVARLIPMLLKLDRYERHARARKMKALQFL
jgi:hypothetical protein